MGEYSQRLIEYGPKIVESLGETGIMMFFSSLAAIFFGLPLGTLLYMTGPGKPLASKPIYFWLNLFVNIIRSFPFLLLVVAMQPAIRYLYGRATGDPIAASFPLMVIAMALYARFVEQSFMDLGFEIVETAQALGANHWQFVRYFLLKEGATSLMVGFTTAFVSFISYSTIMGVVGGGGIGDFAIRYGYQRYENDMMYTAILLMIIGVQVIQWLGMKYARWLRKGK